jgi:hypothetical protein
VGCLTKWVLPALLDDWVYNGKWIGL